MVRGSVSGGAVLELGQPILDRTQSVLDGAQSVALDCWKVQFGLRRCSEHEDSGPLHSLQDAQILQILHCPLDGSQRCSVLSHQLLLGRDFRAHGGLTRGNSGGDVLGDPLPRGDGRRAHESSVT